MADKKTTYLLIRHDGSERYKTWAKHVSDLSSSLYEFEEAELDIHTEGCLQEAAEYFEDTVEFSHEDGAFDYEYGSISGTSGEAYVFAENELVVNLATFHRDLPPGFVEFSARLQGFNCDLHLTRLERKQERIGGHELYLWKLAYEVLVYE